MSCHDIFLHILLPAKIVIIEAFSYCRNDTLPQTVTASNGDKYELRFVGMLSNPFDDSNGSVFMRHGGRHEGWWQQSQNFGRGKSIPIHSEFPTSIPDGHEVLLCFVAVEEHNIESKSLKFLEYMGGSPHALCDVHKIPVISSTLRKGMCSVCDRKEYFCCPVSSCTLSLCKQCVDDVPQGSVKMFVTNDNRMDTNHEPPHECPDQFCEYPQPYDGGLLNNEDDDDSSPMEEPRPDDEEQSMLDYGTGLTADDLDEYVTFSPNDDFGVEETAAMHGDELSPLTSNEIPTTSAGEIPFHVTDNFLKSGIFQI